MVSNSYLVFGIFYDNVFTIGKRIPSYNHIHNHSNNHTIILQNDCMRGVIDSVWEFVSLHN